MRSSLTFASVALLATLAACGTDPAVGDDGNGSGSGLVMMAEVALWASTARNASTAVKSSVI